MTAAERTRLAAFQVPKRRDDWWLGRRTAKPVAAAALAESFPASWPPGALEIANEPGGLPYVRLAPEAAPRAGFRPGDRLPVFLSISHAGGRALCAAAPGGPSATPGAIGIDLGALEPRSEELVRTFFTDEERRLVHDAPAGERDLRANLVWCAKEAVLKALGLGLTVDTLDLTCLPGDGPVDPAVWPLAPAEGEWRPFRASCRPTLLVGGAVRGIWRTFPGFVAALAQHRRLQPAEWSAAQELSSNSTDRSGGASPLGGGAGRR